MSKRAFVGGEILPTNQYGDLEVIGFSENRKYQVRFIQTGYITSATADKIKKGKVKDKMLPFVYGVGYLGGSYYNGKDHFKIYQRWKKMLARCYSGNFDKYYGDCTVCDRWLNFQHFCEDFMNLPGYSEDLTGLDLDKDMLIPGNRIYRPEACQLVDHRENSLYAWGALAGGVIGGLAS